MNIEHTIEDIYPLSPMQQGMLFHSLLAPESGVYLIQFVCTLTGSLDTTRFQQAWNEVIARHTVLRTEFDWSNSDEFLQLVHRHVQLPFAVLDWRYQPNDEPAVTAFLQADRARGIALDQAPLMRVTLLRISDDITQLVWSIHHLLIDGWCLNLVLRDVFSLYESLRWGQRPSLPAAQPYRNYIAWLQQQDLQRAETYWRTTLAGFRAPTALGWSKPATTEPQGYASQRSALSAELSSAVRALARSREVTLNTVFQAAWAILLSRYSGDNDIVFGTTVAGRPPELPAADQIIGLFLNTLPLRTLVDPALPFSAWLSLIQANQSQAREFEYSALLDIQKWSDVPQGQPLFHSIMVFENYPIDRSGRSDEATLSIGDVRAVEQTNLPLTVVIGTGQDLSIKLMYEEAAFTADAIAQILDQFQFLLGQITAQPEQPLGSYSLVSPSARAVLPDPAATLEQPLYSTIPALIAMLAENQPDHPAISQHAQTWSYRDVVAASSQIARQLQPLAPNTVVAVTGQRSFGLIASMIGVLQSGGTLLTIDPLLPAERQSRMLNEAQAALVLVCDPAATTSFHERPALLIDPATGALIAAGMQPSNAALPDIQPEQRAYIFFTSGTTGVPKGVAGTHRGLSHFLDWQRNTFNVGPHDRAAQLTGLSFDVVLRDIFLPLSSGATLCLPDPDATPASAQTLEWIAAERITLVHSVPSLVQNWLTAGSHNVSLDALRIMFLAGEPLTDALVNHWRTNASPTTQIVNLYGPTETTLAKCAYVIGTQPTPGIQPVGFPLPYSQALVLNGDRQCSLGEVGEIVIRTPFRTQGYINAPEEQTQRFVLNPFGSNSEDLLYHTGDLGRYGSNGELHILGRLDQQVKIRGVRVEPAEVANVLLGHPDVAAATVIAFTGPNNEKQLAGYVVPVAQRAEIVNGHKRYLLPNNMAVAHLNKNETDYLYREIFILQAYTRHGVTLRDNDLILDVGANIGLFTSFANNICTKPRIYAFEPNPTVFSILQVNTQLYGPNTRLFNFAISDTARDAEFTFFPGFAMLSGFYTNAEVERETIKSFVANQHDSSIDTSAILADVDDILQERFEPQSFSVRMRTLSEVIREQGIEQVDLLKINVEKSELDVLRGIDEADWPKIKQAVLEVDLAEHLDPIVELLEAHGFQCAVMQDTWLNGTELRYVYAIHPSSSSQFIAQQGHDEHVRDLPLIAPPDYLATDELLTFLHERLPNEMVPSSMILLDQLPVTPNGKIDRAALPDPSTAQRSNQHEFVAPRTTIEATVAEIWQRLLHQDSVGIHDDFFTLGGHSLLATQALARIRDVFNINLPLRTMFETPTIAGLSKRIEHDRLYKHGLSIPPLQAVADRTQLFPLTYTQEWRRFNNNRSRKELSVQIRRVRVPIDKSLLEQSVNALALRHESLRTGFPIINDQPVQQVRSEIHISIPLIDLSDCDTTEQTARQQAFVHELTNKPFDLNLPPLFHIGLLKHADHDFTLVTVFHLMLFDGWSEGIFFRELLTLYQAFLEGSEPNLPKLPIQFADYALWEREWLRGPVLEHYIDQWVGQLRNAPAIFGPRAMRQLPYQSRRFEIPAETTARLRQFGRAEGLPLFNLLFGTLNVLLYAFTEQPDVVISISTANREIPETQALIGKFANVLYIRSDLSGDPTFQEAILLVRDAYLSAIDYQLLPIQITYDPAFRFDNAAIFEQFLADELTHRQAAGAAPSRYGQFNREQLETFAIDYAQVTFNFLPMLSANERGTARSEAVAAGSANAATQTMLSNLYMAMIEETDSIRGTLDYSSDMFTTEQIDTLIAWYINLLEGFTQQPDVELSTISEDMPFKLSMVPVV